MVDSGDLARMERILTRVEKAGVKIREMDGWRSRGRTFERVPVGLIDHHDASGPQHGEWGFLNAIVNGRTSPTVVPGPLSQFQVARCLSVPQVAVCAAGRANHSGTGGPYGPVPKDAGSSWLYGVEKAHGGVSSEPMTPDFHYATDALFAAILAECRDPRLLIGHKEWAPTRKVDPLYGMDWRRKRVASFHPRTEEPERVAAIGLHAGSPIMSGEDYSIAPAIKYVLARSPRSALSDRTVGGILWAYREVCGAAGVNLELAVVQMIHETGALTSWWSQPPRRNPAGMGVTGENNPDGTTAGLSFPSWPEAVAAHVGRLLAYRYAADSLVPLTPYQRRLIALAVFFRPSPRGVGETVGDIAAKWAADPEYAAKLARVAASVRAA